MTSLSPLALELLRHAIASAPSHLDDPKLEALVDLLRAHLAELPDADLALSLPAEPLARQIAHQILSNPAAPLAELLRSVPASRRTVERSFTAETGASLGRWRRRARILTSVRLLAEGANVTTTALHTGYASPSSFVAAFRAELGLTPRAFSRSADQ